jgi:hypothetical protein
MPRSCRRVLGLNGLGHSGCHCYYRFVLHVSTNMPSGLRTVDNNHPDLNATCTPDWSINFSAWCYLLSIRHRVNYVARNQLGPQNLLAVVSQSHAGRAITTTGGKNNPAASAESSTEAPSCDELSPVTTHASFCLVFAGFLRIGGFTYPRNDLKDPEFDRWHITRGSVTLHKDQMELSVPFSKTSPIRRDVLLTIAAADGDAYPVRCPRRSSILHWLHAVFHTLIHYRYPPHATP